MGKTAVADIIIPADFEAYALERTAALSAFGQAGIVAYDPAFNALAAGGGQTVNMPFWQDINPGRQLLSDNAALSVNKITSGNDIARIQNDAQVWSVNHLAKVISGSDPMAAIGSLVGEYWSRVDQALIISCLKGRTGMGWKSSDGEGHAGCPAASAAGVSAQRVARSSSPQTRRRPGG